VVFLVLYHSQWTYASNLMATGPTSSLDLHLSVVEYQSITVIFDFQPYNVLSSILVALRDDFSPTVSAPGFLPNAGSPPVEDSSRRTQVLIQALVAPILYVVLAIPFISLAGVQTDEALFAGPVYRSMTRDVRMFHHNVQLMVMTYIGTLKTFLWAPIFHVFGGNVWSLRFPTVILSAFTIFFFHRLMRIAGISTIAALVAALLLATDPLFLTTNTLDWGPVVLEHFLVVAGCFALVEFWRTRRNVLLAMGCFLFGLALWNKAIAVWSLAALLVAGVTVLISKIIEVWTARRVVIAFAAFLLGIAPLLVYNLRYRSATVRENAHFESLPVALAKWVIVKNTANGNGLLGYIVEEEEAERHKDPSNTLARISLHIREALGKRRESGFYYVLGLLLLAAPLWWRSRIAWFAIVYCATGWFAMAFTKDAGGSIHHTILLWPFPILFAAAVLSRVPWKWTAIPAGFLLVVLNLTVINQYLSQFERYGPARDFTDAIFALSDALPTDKTVYLADWGMLDSITLLREGKVHLAFGSGPFMTDSMDDPQRAEADAMLADEGALFVGHVASQEVFTGVAARLEKYAAGHGDRKELLQVIPDTNGRPRFEIYRWAKR